MNKKQLDEKHQKILRKLLQLPENKKCFDCSEKGPFYACTTLGTFVCTTCSGIHREFQHHVKSISMASFKPEEVQFLEEMGNARAKEIWLAYWTPSDFPEPESTDRARVREFMKLKYERKKWFARPGTKGSNGTRSEKQSRGRGLVEDTPKVEPIESILGKDIPPISITHNLTLPHMGGNGVAQKKEEARVVQPAAPKDPFFVSWEDQTHPAPPHAVQHPTTRSPLFSPQFPPGGAPTPAPYGSGPAPTMPGSSGGGFGGLEAVFSATPEPSTPSSTIWPPPQPGAAPHMMPGMVPAGGAYPPAAVPFQQVSPQVFQQMAPAQQQQYLIMQQQWIQQQQFMLQQRMAHMSLGAPAAGATTMPGAGPYPGAAGMGTNPFLAATAAGPVPTSPVLAPAPYGSAGRPGTTAIPAGNNKQNDALFADLSPLAPKPAGGAPATGSKATTSSPLLPTMAPASPAHTPAAMSNPFGAPAGGAPIHHHQQPPHNPYPSSPSFPAASQPGVPLSPSAARPDGFNPFNSLI